MPFRKWATEPVFLCRKPLPPDKNECELYSVTNGQLVSCMRQLASVAKIADRIFEEIGSECRMVTERCQRLMVKITAVRDVVENLNARAVQVPLSDLSQTARFLHTNKPYETKNERATQLFLPSTRPPCIDQLYNAASPTPVAVICTIDKYRTDGLSSSELFMVTPVLGGEKKRKHKKYLDIETRKPANFSLDKVKQDAVKCGTFSLPSSSGFLLKQNENLELERLPSPEEQAMLVSLEYPSTVVPVDTSGTSFNKMSLLRKSLIHVDFVIKRKKSKKKSKRRHTFCEGQNREIEQAIRDVTNSSCQTDDLLDTTASSTVSIHRSLSKRRSRSAIDNSRRKTLLDELDLDSLQQDSKDSATEDDKEKTPSKSNTTVKKSKTISSLRSRSFNPISSLSAAISIAAVKMRNSTRSSGNKQDDGRSSSGNWSASSSTRASVDSDHQHAASPIDGVSSPSRNSVGKDSVLSDATQFDPHNRSRDEILLIQSLSSSPIKRKKFGGLNLPWEPNGNNRISNTPTPDLTSHCSSSTPVIRSPYAGRRGMSDDGDSSVYSVDTDGYYTSMHTDSGLWCNPNINAIPETPAFRERNESQSSVSTVDNSSINSFLSKSATECSSNSGSVKGQTGPEPPPRVSSCTTTNYINKIEVENKDHCIVESDKSDSPLPQNSSTSESDHEVRDRIRVKTTITANRYPSLCAVSPETSDEEMAEIKCKTEPNVNVIVAEVHREEKSCDNKDAEIPPPMHVLSRVCTSINNFPVHKSSVNMYRSETPLPSNFSSFIPQNNQLISTSTPRSAANITTFSPDLNATRNNKAANPISNFKELCDFDSEEEITVTESPTSQSGSDKSLIPLKYAQRITVTPIARNDSSSNCTGTIKRMPANSHNSSLLNSSGNEKSFTMPFNKKDSQPSYISFQAPDSPISSVSSFNKVSSADKISISPMGSLNRPVARVTLDPSGKVVYSSNSLGRVNSNTNRSTVERSYNTLPANQTYTENRPIASLNLNSNPCKNYSNVSVQRNPNKNTVEGKYTSSPTNQIEKKSPINHNSGTCEINSKSSFEATERENVNINLIPAQKSSVSMISQPTLFTQIQNSELPKPIAGKYDFTFRPSRGGRFCRSYFPSHLISPQASEKQFVKATYTPPASENSKCYINSPQNSHCYISSEENYKCNSKIPTTGSNESAPQQNYCSSHSQAAESQSKYSTSTKSLHYSSNVVPNTISDSNIYSRQKSPSTSIWPGRLNNTQMKNNSNGIRLHQSLINKHQNMYTGNCTKKSLVVSPQSPVVSLRPPDLIPSGESPPSTLDVTSPAQSQKLLNQSSGLNCTLKDPINDQKSLKSMSATELFAIIHSSKKKHNIKTESEISMSPHSSRSVSPALSQSSVSKLQPVETGVLSKRCDTPILDKTKWCNSMPSTFRKQSGTNIGPTKPTSMHDFKMLLLQTRTGVNDPNPRPSAAELLKVSPTRNSPVPVGASSKLPVPSSLKSPTLQYSSYKSPPSHYSSNLSYSPSHGTVPIKRNMRTRSPYLTRYDSAYPPIMEDCSEEIENYEDNKCLNTIPSYNQMLKMPESVPKPAPVTKATSTWV